MIFVDQHEPLAIELYLKQSVDTSRILLNKPAKPPRPDYVFLDHEGKYIGVSRKQNGEFVGGIDATEVQLLEEMAGVEYMALLIEGWFSPNPDGGVDIWKQRGNVFLRSRTLKQNYLGVQQKLARFRDLGISVLHTDNEYSTALTLVALYKEAQKPESESKTFKRLIREKYRLTEEDERKRRLALTLMGIEGAGLGEEIAMALASNVSSFQKLLTWLYEDEEAVAAIPLRSGKRTVGPAAVKRLKEAVGL